MRLGNVNASSNTVSTIDDCRDTFSSDCGEFGDDGRSDTTELPDLLPTNSRDGLPDSPMLYPRGQKFKSLDEILPSFDTTEPSDDENQPPDNPFPVPVSHHSQASHISARYTRAPSDYDDEGDGFDDEADETYIVREEEGSDENDGDYDDDLDDVPLKMRRERKMSSVAPPPPPQPKPKQQMSKGVAKVIKRRPSMVSKPRPPTKNQQEPHYPISPASPPASRKPSVASSGGSKPRTTVAIPNHGPGTPFPQEKPNHHHDHLLPPFDDLAPGEEPRPRCQRCRKSKKGCDRQRPCQRCKDAGIPSDQCISEDEAGTRRGRQAAAAAKKAGMAGGMLKPKPKKKKKVV